MTNENIKLEGIIPPMITPLVDDNTLDKAGVERLIEHMIRGGIHGLFILGSTGEAPSLSYALRYELIDLACRLVDGRIPVLVGITDTSLQESVNMAEYAAEQGAVAVVSAPPYYFIPSQEELIVYYNELAARSPLPLYLYNMPSYVKVIFEPDTVVELAKHPNIIGLKDSSADMVYFQSLLNLFREESGFSLLMGPEELMAESVLMGATGGVNGGANMFPELYVDLYNAAVNRDYERIKALQDRVMEISSNIYTIDKYGAGYLKGVKCVLSLMRICNDFMASPFRKFPPEMRGKVQTILKSWGIKTVDS